MADYSGLDEATLNEKLKAASDYEERSAIRKALRQLKKEQGRPVGRQSKREATYNRFAGRALSTSKPAVTPHQFYGKETSGPARGGTPTQTPPTQSPFPYSPPPSQTPPPAHTPSPLEVQREPPSPVPSSEGPDGIPSHTEETDGIPPYTEEPEPSFSPQPPSPPKSPSPPPSPPRSPSPSPDSSEKFQEELVDGTDEGVEPGDDEGVEPDDQGEGGNEGVEPDEEIEPEEEEPDKQEPDNEEAEPVGAEPDKELADDDQEEEEKEEVEKEVEVGSSQRSSQEVEQEEEKPHPREEAPAITANTSTDEADWSPFGKKLRSKRPEVQSREKTGTEKAEFQGLKLRKTLSQERQDRPSHTSRTHDFGVKLRSRDSRPAPSTTDVIPTKRPSSPPRTRAKTYSSPRTAQRMAAASSPSSGPRTLRDYQELSARSHRAKVRSPDQDSEEGSTMPVDELQRYLVMYVNQELALSPPIPSRGKALYDTCSDTTNLCKLINKSVRNTVDLRALSTISSSMSAADREEAQQDNMTLTIESARAIGCRITDSTGDLIMRKDPPTIRGFLVDLIRARVVNLPGMDDEPTTTFTNLSALFSKLGISEVDGDGGGEGEEEDRRELTWRERDSERLRQALKTPPKSPPTTRSWREAPSSPKSSEGLTYEERAAMRRAEREKREERREKGESEDTTGLTYEERAAMRKAERERRRKERAELAGAQ